MGEFANMKSMNNKDLSLWDNMALESITQSAEFSVSGD